MGEYDGADVLAGATHLLQRRVEVVGVAGEARVDDSQAVGTGVDDVPVDVARAGAPDAGCDFFHGFIVSRPLNAMTPAVTRARLVTTAKNSSGAWTIVWGSS